MQFLYFFGVVVSLISLSLSVLSLSSLLQSLSLSPLFLSFSLPLSFFESQQQKAAAAQREPLTPHALSKKEKERKKNHPSLS